MAPALNYLPKAWELFKASNFSDMNDVAFSLGRLAAPLVMVAVGFVLVLACYPDGR
jgi:hypothetical protein